MSSPEGGTASITPSTLASANLRVLHDLQLKLRCVQEQIEVLSKKNTVCIFGVSAHTSRLHKAKKFKPCVHNCSNNKTKRVCSRKNSTH